MRRRWLLPLLLCFSMSLFASEYRMAVVSFTPEADTFASVVKEQLDALLHGGAPISVYDLMYRQDGQLHAKQQEQWKKLSDTYAKEDETAILPSLGPGPLSDVDRERRDFLVNIIPYDADLSAIFQKKAYQWYCDLYTYDAIVLVSVETLSGHQHLLVSLYERSSDSFSLLLDRLSFDENYADAVPSLRLSLLESIRNERIALLTLTNVPPSLVVTIDGMTVPVNDNVLFLTIGKHLIHLSAYGYVSKEEEITALSGDLLSMDATLERLSIPTLSLLSRTGTVSWSIDGVSGENGSLLSMENAELPMLVQAKKQGFSTLTKQIGGSDEIINFRLIPSWADDAELRKEKQKSFYASFVSLIVATGLTLAYPTLYNVYGNGNVFSETLRTVGTGAIATTGILLLGRMMDYIGSSLDY